jgi:hypothetical protein
MDPPNKMPPLRAIANNKPAGKGTVCHNKNLSDTKVAFCTESSAIATIQIATIPKTDPLNSLLIFNAYFTHDFRPNFNVSKPKHAAEDTGLG